MKQFTPMRWPTSVARKFTLDAMAPGLAQFRNYKPSYLRGDLLGGLTVAAYLVPQVMAYATLVGVPAINGLWCAAALALYAIFGTSRLMSAGPESTVALMTGTAIAPLAAGDMGVPVDVRGPGHHGRRHVPVRRVDSAGIPGRPAVETDPGGLHGPAWR